MSETTHNRDFENLLEYIKRSRGFDFSGYKRSNLSRRVGRRMSEVGIESSAEYLNYLEAQPDEFVRLFNTVLINVTGFFRDPASWDYVAKEIVPRIMLNKRPEDPIRVWAPGCASGEEAYTLAMVFAETAGEQALRERVKIFGTDVDEEALNQARLAVYGEDKLTDVPEALREKYFERSNGRFAFRKELRRAAIFGRHDLVQDPPISRVDLLVCRNTLMYFNAETQTKILGRLHFALGDTGFLFLGKAEMLLTRAHLFTPVDVKYRVFSKVVRVPARDRALADTTEVLEEGEANGTNSRLRDTLFEASPVAQLAVDVGGTLLAINDRARALFGVAPTDVGRPLRDLEISYRPIDLRSLIDNAFTNARPVGVVGAEWRRPTGEVHYLDVQVIPLFAGRDRPLGVTITFLDMSRLKQLQDENLRARQELETYTEELQAANEELETTNEELQSTNEELETTNEELQSANEELETINEELQSTNQELETVNQELQERTNQLHRANGFQDAILSGLGVGIAVLDRELRVQMWNRRAADLWGLREDEVRGQHFLNLDIGLPVGDLRQPLRQCLAAPDGRADVTLDAVDRRGRPVRCRIRCGPLTASSDQVHGVILLMEAGDDDNPQ